MKKTFKMPHIYIIIVSIMLLAAVATYLVPAGVFDRVVDEVTGRELIVKDTFHTVDRNPTSVLGFFIAMPKGIVDAGWIFVLTFCVGGGFAVLRETGVITGAIGALSHKLAHRGIIIIPILTTVFAVIDCFIGMPEMNIVYVPMLIPIMLALGFDSITACATAMVGSAAGFTAAIANPFTVIIAQKICGLPLYSGWQFRVVVLVIVLAVGIVFTMRYALRVKKDPSKALAPETDALNRSRMKVEEGEKMALRVKLAGIVALLLFLLMIYGVISWGWDMPEIGGIFMAIGIVSGIVAGLSGDQICDYFMKGCQDVLLGAIMIGLARGISVILSDAYIIDTIVYYLSRMVEALPPAITSIGMLIVQTALNFLIPSGSGQTVVSMPIMAPLADMVGVTRQTAVLALQFGDGFTNIIYPVSGYLMASLTLAGVPYQKWVKFILPLIIIWTVIAAVTLVFAQAIAWGPF